MNPDCIECRDQGVTKRGVCTKCPAGPDFIAHRTDGGALQMWSSPELARAVLGGGEKQPDADREPRRPLEREETAAELVTIERATGEDFPTGDAIVERRLRPSSEATVLQRQLREAVEANAALRQAAERGRMAEAAAVELQRQLDTIKGNQG
jgi:hypothetical protein